MHADPLVAALDRVADTLDAVAAAIATWPPERARAADDGPWFRIDGAVDEAIEAAGASGWGPAACELASAAVPEARAHLRAGEPAAAAAALRARSDTLRRLLAARPA